MIMFIYVVRPHIFHLGNFSCNTYPYFFFDIIIKHVYWHKQALVTFHSIDIHLKFTLQSSLGLFLLCARNPVSRIIHRQFSCAFHFSVAKGNRAYQAKKKDTHNRLSLSVAFSYVNIPDHSHPHHIVLRLTRIFSTRFATLDEVIFTCI